MRLFISIEIPDKIKKTIDKMTDKLKMKLTPIKWVENKNLHLTLKFIGWTDDDKVGKLTGIVEKTVKGYGSFNVTLAGMGVFPTVKSPRVIWIGMLEGAEKVKALGERIEDAVSKEGFREEEREYTPHLTIGRIKEKIDVEPLCGFMEKNKDSSFGGFSVDHISVMKSTLRRTGPIYEEIGQIKL